MSPALAREHRVPLQPMDLLAHAAGIDRRPSRTEDANCPLAGPLQTRQSRRCQPQSGAGRDSVPNVEMAACRLVSGRGREAGGRLPTDRGPSWSRRVWMAVASRWQWTLLAAHSFPLVPHLVAPGCAIPVQLPATPGRLHGACARGHGADCLRRRSVGEHFVERSSLQHPVEVDVELVAARRSEALLEVDG